MREFEGRRAGSDPQEGHDYDEKEDVYICKTGVEDRCRDLLSHKRPEAFDFLAVNPTMVNPYPITNGAVLITPKLAETKRSLSLPMWAIKKMWSVFAALDTKQTGYLVLDHLFALVKETHTSIIAPFMERIYEISMKHKELYLPFDEFVAVLSTYCIMSNDEVLSFVFYMLDRDRDGIITKDAIFEFLEFERESNKIFPPNIARAVELYQLHNTDKGGQIDADEFRSLAHAIPFLVFPAYRLQESLRRELVGEDFWTEICQQLEEKKLQKRIQKIQTLVRGIKESESKKTQRGDRTGRDKDEEQIDSHPQANAEHELMSAFSMRKNRELTMKESTRELPRPES